MQNNESYNKFIEELKAKNDIVSVISRYVPLERKGRTFWAKCPFHGEKTASFAINENDQFYHCFGCGVGGDVIKFVQEIESVDFMGAVQILADLAHMDVPSFSSGNSEDSNIKKRKDEKDRLLALMKDTARHYVENLKSPLASPGLKYFEKRKISPEVARMFGLGYSLNFTEIIEFLKSKGYTLSEMEKAGVVKNKDGKPYDAIGGRVVFPIIDTSSNVIAFCGRTLDPNPNFAKYINTAETPLFSKSKNLYAINLVKKARLAGQKIESLIVVEGQMDVVSLHKAGFNTAVASMGTALTNEQAKLLKRFADKVYICYDGDTAGKKATLRGLDILRSTGLDVYVMSMPEGLDPDDVINRYGKEGYQKLISRALPLIDFKIEYLKKSYDVSSPEGKTKFLSEAIEVLRSLDDVEREVYIEKVADIAGVLKDFVKRQTEKTSSAKDDLSFATKSNIASLQDKREKKPQDARLVQAEKFVLSAMLHKKPYAFSHNDLSEYFSEERVDFYKAIRKLADEPTEELAIQKFYSEFSENKSEEASEIISYMLKNMDSNNDQTYYRDCEKILIKNYTDCKIKELTSLLEHEVEKDKQAEILKKINELVLKSKTKVDL